MAKYTGISMQTGTDFQTGKGTQVINMIERSYNTCFGVCDICGEITEDFDDFYNCKDWCKENWSYHWNENRQEWELLCDDCKALK